MLEYQNLQLNFIAAPVLGFLLAGSIKFIINSIKVRKYALDQVGLGGFPSTHNTITSATFFTIGFSEGFGSSMATIALTLCIIVAIDSIDLRRKIETHAQIISENLRKYSNKAKEVRVKIAHHPIEVLAGWLIGASVGYCLS